ncbi:glycoside hydrolase superfamily, partial [Phlyctochytrium arcticum]
ENEIDAYCSGPYNVLNIAFANVFKNAENTIDINLSSHCGETFPGSTVLNCPLVGQAIRRCQNLGKKVILSLGGGIASVGFSDLADVNRFTLALWNMFLGGTQAGFVRPFGPGVILDGIDLDVEGGDDFGYDIFLRDIRALMDTDASGRKFFITAAPQCFFPDVLQDTAYAKGYFDWLNIQWYNNPCGNFAFPTPAWQDAVEFWVNWANTVSANPNVRLLIGAPSSIAAASPQSFVPLVSTSDTAQPSMTTIIARWKQDYRTRFGGVMLWEVTTADSNENFAQGVRDILDA